MPTPPYVIGFILLGRSAASQKERGVSSNGRVACNSRMVTPCARTGVAVPKV